MTEELTSLMELSAAFRRGARLEADICCLLAELAQTNACSPFYCSNIGADCLELRASLIVCLVSWMGHASYIWFTVVSILRYVRQHMYVWLKHVPASWSLEEFMFTGHTADFDDHPAGDLHCQGLPLHSR